MTIIGALLLLSLVLILPARAQGQTFDLNGLNIAAPGSQGNTTYLTGQGPLGAYYAPSSNPTNQQVPWGLNPTTTRGLAPIFGMGSGYYSGYPGSGATGGPGYVGAPEPFTAAQLATLNTILPGSTFAQNHPRRTEVLENDSNLYNQANSGALGSQTASALSNQALNIADEEQSYAYQNGGYITQPQQALLNQQEAVVGQELASGTAIPTTGF